MAERKWWILKVTGWGEVPVYGTEQEAEQRREAEEERRGKVTRKQPADPSNITHRERVEEELKVQRELRKTGGSSYGDMELPELVQQ